TIDINFTLPYLAFLNGARSVPYPTTQYLHDNVQELLCMSLIACAAFFLSVLIARIRFTTAFRDVDRVIRTAAALKEKEEDAHRQGDRERVSRYLLYVENLLSQADPLLMQLYPVIQQMQLMRNLGMICFVLALTLCGLLFNDALALLLFVVFLLAVMWGEIE